MAARPIPDGYRTLTPYIICSDAPRMIEFLEETFGAEVTFSHKNPDGKLGHAEVRVIDSMVMLSQARGNWGPMPAMYYIYVTDCDAVYRRALAAGATAIDEMSDRYYGDRNGGVKDFDGNMWFIGTHKEDVSPEELERRQAALEKKP